jgi:2-C-methyl-D-erythritol 4-phosphate cytidylyltransferase
MMVEALGGTVRVVEGESANIKITTPADLETAAGLVAARGA